MVIIGAKGHAREILDIIEKDNLSEEIFFYDDISNDLEKKLFNRYEIIRNIEELSKIKIKKFIIGVGNPWLRKKLSDKFSALGWEMISVISKQSIIGNHDVILEKGLNVMHNVFISNEVIIGEGTLINNGANIHHNVTIGKFCEISPKVCVTGNVTIGNYSSIGASTVIIPKISIGNNCVIGAGSVVTKDIPDNSVAVGVPAKVIKEVEPFNE